MVAMRYAGQEARRVGGEALRQRLGHGVGKFVLVDRIPHVEEQRASGAEHAPGLCERLALVGEEHDPELAHDQIERLVGEGQLHRIGLTPCDRTGGADRGRMVEHRLIEVGGDDRGAVRERRREGACHHAGSCRYFEYPRWRDLPCAGGHVGGVGLEDERHHVALVELRDGACECAVRRCAVIGCAVRVGVTHGASTALYRLMFVG